MSDSHRVPKPLYRLFHLNRAGGIDRAEIIEAVNDEDAIRQVHDLADDHAIELWDRARFIAKAGPPLLALVPEPVIVRGRSEPLVALSGVEAPGDDQMAKLVH